MQHAGRELRRKLFQLAAGQGGFFTAAQAKAVGYSYANQAYHVRVGNWHRVDRGLFRLVDWPLNRNDDLIRWTLWSKGRAAVSHHSALAAYEIGEFESPQVHLTVPNGFRSTDAGVTLHRHRLPAEDVSEHEGFKITTVPRTLADVADLSPDQSQLARAVDEAIDRGLVTARQLRSKAETVSDRAALFVERALGAGSHR